MEHPLGLAIPKLIEVQMPKPGDFAQFRSQIEKDYIDAKATELMQAAAKKLSDTARTQGSLEKAAKEMGLSTKAASPLISPGRRTPRSVRIPPSTGLPSICRREA